MSTGEPYSRAAPKGTIEGTRLGIRSFEKGLADRGGWREEILDAPGVQASFLYPFSYAPLGEGGHISGELFWRFLGVCLSPTPSRQPLFETSEGNDKRPGSRGFKKLSEIGSSSFEGYESSQNTCLAVSRCSHRGADDP